jgi:hypothetical protein
MSSRRDLSPDERRQGQGLDQSLEDYRAKKRAAVLDGETSGLGRPGRGQCEPHLSDAVLQEFAARSPAKRRSRK